MRSLRSVFCLTTILGSVMIWAPGTTDVALAQCDAKGGPLGVGSGDSVASVDGKSVGGETDLHTKIELVKGGEVVVLTVPCSEASTPIAARIDSFKNARGGPTDLFVMRARAADKALGDDANSLIPLQSPGSGTALRPGPRDLIPSRPRLTETAYQDPPAGRIPSSSPVVGVALQNRSPAGGVVVESVEAGSPAWRDGLRQADVIASANRIPVRDIAALETALASAGPTVVLEVRRGGMDRVVVLHR